MDWKKNLKIMAGVLAGNAILAFAVAAFIVPNGIIMGGATGIGLTITHYIPLNLSIAILGVNAILFLFGVFTLGKTFAITTILSTFVYPVFLEAARQIPGVTALTENRLLAALYGGLFIGIGAGLVVRQGASTGGTDIVALVLHKYLHSPVAMWLYIVDFAVLSTQILFSDSEQVLYGILSLVIMSAAINQVVLFGQAQIQLFIISEKHEVIRMRLLKDMDVGPTMVHIETGYSKEQQKGVLCVIPHRKLYTVNDMIRTIDEKAFITISQIKEVKGHGFSMERVKYPLDKAD